MNTFVIEQDGNKRHFQEIKQKPKASVWVALLLALIITGLSIYGFYKIYEFAVIQNCMPQEVEETK